MENYNFCLNCGEWIGGNGGVCPKCATLGAAQNDFRYVGATEQLNAPKSVSTEKLSSKPKYSTFGILFLTVGLFGAAVLGLNNCAVEPPLNLNRNIPPQNSAASIPPRSESQKPKIEQTPKVEKPKAENDIFLDKSFHVAAQTYELIRFEVKDKRTLTGEFSAQGGSNDIRLIIIDEKNLVNLKNGTYGRLYFDSNYTAFAEVEKTLPQGVYFLVFDNRAALMTNKTVTAKFQLK